MNKNFLLSLFDTKYLAVEMKEYLFTRQNRSNKSKYIENITTATSLSSLYDLLTSKYYDSLIFFKPIIELNSTHRYKNENFVIDIYPMMSRNLYFLMYFFRNMKPVMMHICLV